MKFSYFPIFCIGYTIDLFCLYSIAKVLLPMYSLPTLYSTRLLLRLLTSEDVPRLTELLQEPEIAANGLGIPQPYQLADAEQMVERVAAGPEKNHFTWGITLKNNHELIGIVTLILTTAHRRGEIGYWIGKAFWNLGYATEAAQTLIYDAFIRHDLNRIYAKSFVGNESSRRVLEKLGMQYEGLLRQYLWHPLSQEFKDTHVYSMLRSEFEIKSK